MMAIDEDDDDDLLFAADGEAAIAHHSNIVLLAQQTFRLEEERQQQAMAVLAMVDQFGISSSSKLLSLEALLLFYHLLLSMGHNWRGSLPGKAINRERGREAALQQLVADYFSGENSKFTEVQFRRRFRMSRPLFLRIVQEISDNDVYFQQRPDATGKVGASALQKVTAACRLLA